MDKINILFVIPQLEKGGSETLVYDVASRLDKSLFDVSLAYFHFYGNEQFKKAFKEQGIRLYQIPRNGAVDISTMQMMSRIIRENNIHTVNAHHYVSMFYSFYACKIANRCGMVYTEHSSWEVESVPWKWELIGRLLLRRLDCVIGVSDGVTQALNRKYHLQGKNTLTVRNGVVLNGYRSSPDRQLIRAEFGIAEHEKVVMTVANFRKVKNHLFLLRAFKELVNELKSVKLLLVGQGVDGDPENSEKEVRGYVEEYGLHEKVFLTGHRNDVRDLLSIADVFCLTSLREGLPISMLEAMSTGLPVVGTNVPGIRDVIIQQRNGLLVDLGDHISLKKAIYDILKNEDLRLKYGRESRRIVEELYSMNQCVDRYAALFMRMSKK